ncbi:D-serine ammonia-lyase [Pseudomonas flavescens]|uniref:Probable D-serine dehydratase n=1 Tax=Phytopseudomonas flavescens TaxID=29435 RepID=A0A1G8PV87_9GAMM|nr:D-serine ammonia-lyase [Pseudomonas flavescens]SDI96176.1 D-serine ammonia-lyase [Pseudomonas flavescens]
MPVSRIPSNLLENLRARQPLLWCNPALVDSQAGAVQPDAQIEDARQRLARCAPLLMKLFSELESCNGIIESDLQPADALRLAILPASQEAGHWFIKRDDQLPVAGSVKARGGFHEVLAFAEGVALEHGLLSDGADRRVLASAEARELFGRYSVTVGSTGNLGLSIGVMAAALGFDAVVHMSADAKQWKKDRLRDRGVRVVEHSGDYAQAVAAGRAQAEQAPRSHFVDDERSPLLFFGYAVAARHLARQLAEHGRKVDAQHPLCVYIPCGVGGAPGGIAYGLKVLFGEHVHCFFAEPVASPCVLVQMAAGCEAPVSVYDIGLDNRTEADGLAVGLASAFVCPLMVERLSGVFTVADDRLYLHMLALKNVMGVEVEPSAAAAIGGPRWLVESAEGQAYASARNLDLRNATHVIWATGGSLVPRRELDRFIAHARGLDAAT